MIIFLNQILPALQSILILAGLIGGTIAGVFATKNLKKSGLVQIQSDTIETMQKQIDALKEQNKSQQEKIDHLEYKFDLVTDALKDEGILITVDGEKVTIKDEREPNINKHIIKRSTRKVPLQGKKDEA